jgi:hypothetical protein
MTVGCPWNGSLAWISLEGDGDGVVTANETGSSRRSVENPGSRNPSPVSVSKYNVDTSYSTTLAGPSRTGRHGHGVPVDGRAGRPRRGGRLSPPRRPCVRCGSGVWPHLDQRGGVFELTLLPLPALAADGYPEARVRIVLLPDGRVRAYARGSGDCRFKHRNPWPGRDLCLQYADDDRALRWIPADGLEALVTLVHRHLIFEETWRHTGRWPCEDAPHGRAGEKPHPVTTARMHREVARWTRPRTSALLHPAKTGPSPS